jgi:hypothetical protein
MKADHRRDEHLRSSASAQVFTHQGILKTTHEQVRFARTRFGTYDLSDFVAVLIGYAVSGEPLDGPETVD